MNGLSITNTSDLPMLLIIEPIAEEYTLDPGERIDIGPPFFLDYRKIVDVQVGAGEIVLFLPEEANLSKDGKLVRPNNFSE
jgi:hypothetical protein